MTEHTDQEFGNLSIDEMTYKLIEDPSLRPSITEDNWLKNWLPLFLGVIKTKVNENGKEIYTSPMMEWTRVARSVYESVNVVDEENRVLFVVPPLMRTVSINQKQSRVPLAAMVHHAAQLRDAGRANQARTVLSNYIQDNLEVSGDIVQEIKIWNDIFGRYEVSKHLVFDIDELSKKSPERTEEASPQTTSKQEDGGSFDEFEF